ncbi:MAG: serine protease [Candidatus Pacebacteria bacterium]|nr:serine protease [Candidatus Paceibacterota bacterium]
MKTKLGKACLFLLILFIMVFTTSCSFPGNPVGVYNRTKDSVVEISTNSGGGTGFIYKDQSHIATAYHVVKSVPNNSWEIIVKIKGAEEVRACIENFDVINDLAILKLDHALDSIKPLTVSLYPEVGEPAYVIGNSFGFYPKTLTAGVISGVGRKSGPIAGLIQFDAKTVPGDSGGPLLNQMGGVLGVVCLGDDDFGYAESAAQLKILAEKEIPQLETQPVIVEVYNPANPSSGTYEVSGAMINRTIWETNFKVENGFAELRFLKFKKGGYFPDYGFLNFSINIDGNTILESERPIDADGFLTLPFYWDFFEGMHGISLMTTISGGNYGSFKFTLEDIGFSAPDMVGRQGEKIPRDVQIKSWGQNFSGVSAGTITVFPSERG